MSPLADEIVTLLGVESSRPLALESIRQVLKAACGIYTKDGELETVLDGLLQDGKIEIVQSMKVGARYRISKSDPPPAA